MSGHRPVLLGEAVDALAIRADGCYVDATFGRGGHAAEILRRLGPEGALQAFDQDAEAIAEGRAHFAAEPRLQLQHARFDALEAWAEAAGRVGAVDGVLMDLGVSSPQLDTPERGFSFLQDGPLDMRMDTSRGEPVSAWLARARAEDIADVLYLYGEERASRRIARAIVARRDEAPLTRTRELAQLIERVLGRRGRIHPATRSFQALRIHINDELEVLQSGLAQAATVLAVGGRLAVISFHSLEDRIVKRFLRDRRDLRPIQRAFAGDAEAAANPRARSAVLRVAEKLPPEPLS